ncbi:MAG TPA: hypothetical protein ENH34_03510, partial [Phycisphaerales bacterium]|nr:hypothetical protein [Phycisphaerales bacterium]
MKTVTIILAGSLLALAGGCENANSRQVSLTEQIQVLREEKTQLTRQLEQSKTENKQFKKQVQVLAGLKPEVKLENLYDLQKIRIGRYTNFYDKDKDGKKEK